MIDSIERYLKGEMLPEEKVFFENMRNTNPSLDQMVVEHTLFLNQLNQFGERRNFTSSLNEVHNELYEAGEIKEVQEAKVIKIWKKYKRVVAVAASIAGITALVISGLISYLSPKVDTKIEQLSRKLQIVEQKQNAFNNQINEIKQKQPADAKMKLGGTGFLVDGKGYLVTNAHVVNNARAIVVQNNKGDQFKAKILLSRCGI